MDRISGGSFVSKGVVWGVVFVQSIPGVSSGCVLLVVVVYVDVLVDVGAAGEQIARSWINSQT